MEALAQGSAACDSDRIPAGSCPGYGAVAPFFRERVENTVNAIANRCVSELQRDLRRVTACNEVSAIHMLFRRFSKRINACMFFWYIPFLEQDFKDELYRQTASETERVMSQLLQPFKESAARSNSTQLDEELFLIGRIRLFDGVRHGENHE